MGFLETSVRKRSRGLKIAAIIVILIIAAVSVFAALTYPRTTLNFPVYFTAGAQIERKEFNVPMLHGWVQVQVVISSGTALWAAGILSEGSELWSHRAAQGGQTTYNSGWMQMTSGNYNFTFAAVGFGTLAAEITVSSKGGVW